MSDTLIAKVRERAIAKQSPYGVPSQVARDIALDLWGDTPPASKIRTLLECFMTESQKVQDYPLAEVLELITAVELFLAPVVVEGLSVEPVAVLV